MRAQVGLRASTFLGLALAGVLAACDGGGLPDRGPDGQVCGAEPIEGCPCAGEQTVECGHEPVVTGAALSCRYGEQRCAAGRWTACEPRGERPPPPSFAGGDLGTTSAALIVGPVRCNPCDPVCFTHTDRPGPADLPGRSTNVVYDTGAGGVILTGMGMTCTGGACETSRGHGVGTGTPWAPTPSNSDGVVVDPADGALTLGFTTNNANGVWIASMDDGTVSRLDPTTGAEVGRYPSTRPDATNQARPWNEACNWSDRGNCPSRTAVDQNYDVYVANRAFGNRGTVTKIAGSLANCRDRNGDGIIQTSRDINGNGRIDMGTAEFVGVNDECLLWTVRVGDINGVPRALAVGVAPAASGVGDVWVGLFNQRRACRLSPATGASLGCVNIGNVYPYGAVADASGRIWFTSRAWSRDTLGHVDPATMAFTAAAQAPTEVISYGISVWTSPDLSQTYLFIADSDRNALLRYNVNTNTWFRRLFSDFGIGATPRGVAADETYVWVSRYATGSGWTGFCSNELFAINIPNLDGGVVYGLPASSCHLGVGVGFDNAIWSVAAGTSNAVRLAPDRLTAIATPSLFVSPYTYSDFIGFGLNVFANPRGHYRFVVDSGADCITYRWQAIDWSADVPPETSVEFFVRSAGTVADLATRPWLGPFTGIPANLTVAPGPVPAGRYLEVEVRLATTNRSITPRVYSASARGQCDTFLYPPSGSYRQLYDTTTRCASNERPRWGLLTWDVDTPAGTRVDFELRAAATEAGLTSASPIVVSVPPSTPPVDVEARLRAAGLPFGLSFLSVTAVLRSSADRLRTPTLYEFGLDYTCAPIE
ncbi:MAG: hypothetical protein KF729_14305 [Sandaracinaceae bacterium]|nr:hypothetical protein [Sandaracinaceae bacterium]